MNNLYELLDAHEDKLLRAWTNEISGGQETPPEPEDGHRAAREKERARAIGFLAELKTALAAAASTGAPSPPSPKPREREPGPGEAVEPGPDIPTTTRAFGALHTLLLELAADGEVVVSPAEQMTLATHTHAAIAWEAEAHLRQYNRELWRTAHQLRNPLGSAMMALTLLRSRVDFGQNARLAETLERNLKRIEGLIDEAVADHKGSSLSSSSSSTIAPHASEQRSTG
jgi:signal transduction histidine kinase